MNRKILGVFLVLLPLAAVTACETPAPSQTLPEITFEHLEKIRLNVGDIQVTSGFVSPMKSPNVEYKFQTPPAKALRRWADDRLRAEGTKGSARFVIVDASVTETPLKADKSLTGVFTKQQSVRYTAKIEATLEILDEKGFRKGFASARVSRSRTMSEDVSLFERERQWFELIEALMNDFNAEIEKNIRQYLSGYLF